MLTTYLPELITILTIQIIALVTPGPDFAITLRNSLMYRKKVALFGVLGTMVAVIVHLLASFVGTGFLLHQAPWFLKTIQAVGALWLMYLGYQSIRKATAIEPVTEETVHRSHHKAVLSKVFKQTFVTALLNPFVVLTFVSILTNEIKIDTPLSVQVFYGVAMFVVELIWWIIVVFVFSQGHVQRQFMRLGHWIDRVTGGALIVFGFRMALIMVR